MMKTETASRKYLLPVLLLIVMLLSAPSFAQYQVGQTVSDFTLTSSTGGQVSLSDFDGQAKVLNFFATW